MTGTGRSVLPAVVAFSAQGAQWDGMGRALLELAPFRAVIVRCDRALRRHVPWSLLVELERPPGEYRAHREPHLVQPAMTAIQLALWALLRRRGVEVGAATALSMGEAAAACAAGVLDLDQAMEVACATAALAETPLPPGGMAFLRADWEQAGRLVARHGAAAALAVELGARLSVISGGETVLAAVLAEAREEGIEGGPLPLAQAYHSPQVDVLAPGFLGRLGALAPGAEQVALYSGVTGGRLPAIPPGGSHWWRVCREPSRFWTVARRLVEEGFTRFVELGPHPMLCAVFEQAGAACGRRVETHWLMERGAPAARLDAGLARIAA